MTAHVFVPALDDSGPATLVAAHRHATSCAAS
jgi:hypothetical protein